MLDWLKKKDEVQKLKEQYTNLMAKSYQLALKNKEESDRVNREALRIFELIKRIKSGDEGGQPSSK